MRRPQAQIYYKKNKKSLHAKKTKYKEKRLGKKKGKRIKFFCPLELFSSTLI
tara:strand:+ start:319 stop:474 length:156 start_codon:yes stop_codon:yes gene_type:complete